jgi:meso-butanediol dehydrogenase/(S,S)-butanediol dehydrogenase/diacetyl reductase
MTMNGKVATMTGAARGIGRGIALRLVEAGADVVLADVGVDSGDMAYPLASAAELEAAAKEAERAGVRTLAVPCDVTRADQVEALIQKTRDGFGRVDLLVNNAGVVDSGALEQIDEARWDHVYAVNVKGVFLASRAAVPSLVETQGSIVNIASVAGKRGHAGMSLYCSSKFAVVGFTQSLAAELGPRGVRANAVCPGILATHMWTHHLASDERGGQAAYDAAIGRFIPLGRQQTPEDIAGAVLYLATAENVTGIALNVAGGMEVW